MRCAEVNMSLLRTKIQFSEDIFGEITYRGEVRPVRRFTWTGENKAKVQLINYGACITVLELPDKYGNSKDVVVGFNNIDDYLKPENAYFGATIGRVANRIKNGQMTVEGVKYQLAKNDGANHLHGGIRGFDKVLFDCRVHDQKVTLSYLSKDMEEGYPGDLLVNITFQYTDKNRLIIDYRAATTKTTPVNLTNHSYFNFAGSDSGPSELYNHYVLINSETMTETGRDGVPTGRFLDTSGTIFDLKVPKRLGDVIDKVPNFGGYDHNFCVLKGSGQEYGFAARLGHTDSGRVMEVYTDQPGVQFYTGNLLPEGQTLKGKTGFIQKHGAFCLEAQIYPNAVNEDNFPNVLLHPGEIYKQRTTYKFCLWDC